MASEVTMSFYPHFEAGGMTRFWVPLGGDAEWFVRLNGPTPYVLRREDIIRAATPTGTPSYGESPQGFQALQLHLDHTFMPGSFTFVPPPGTYTGFDARILLTGAGFFQQALLGTDESSGLGSPVPYTIAGVGFGEFAVSFAQPMDITIEGRNQPFWTTFVKTHETFRG